MDEETGGFVENKDSISQQRGTLFEIVAADRIIDLHIELEVFMVNTPLKIKIRMLLIP